MEPREIRFETRNFQYAAREWGPPSAPPLLALHGWMDNAASFDRVAPLLEGWRVVALDFPGHGHTPHRAGPAAYHFVDWIADIHAVTQAMGGGAMPILAHSMGGIAGMMFTAAFPEKVTKLILLDAIAPFLAEPEELPARLRDYAIERDAFDETKKRAYSSFEEAVEARSRSGLPDREIAATLVRRSVRRREDGKWDLLTDRRLLLRTPGRLVGAQADALMRALRCPVLLVSSSEGEYAKYRETQEARLKLVADFREKTIAAGHHFHLEKPGETAQFVLEFLA